MDGLRNEMALANAQELINVCCHTALHTTADEQIIVEIIEN
jgi:hypothetical protein